MQYQVIDAHHHPDWYGYSVDKFVMEMNQFKIDKSWLLTWDCPAIDLDPEQFNVLSEEPYLGANGPVTFSRCLHYKEKYPDRFVLGYAPDPRRPEAIDSLEAAISLYDVKVCGEIKLRMMYDTPDAVEYFKFCGKKRLPVILHYENPIPTGSKYPRRFYWYGGDMCDLERLLKKCPETNFLGHALGFWSAISGDGKGLHTSYPDGPVLPGGRLIELLRRYPNLHCDISAKSGLTALRRDPCFAKEFIDEFQDRVLYARDCFGNAHMEFLKGLQLPPSIEKKLFNTNAARLSGEVQ